MGQGLRRTTNLSTSIVVLLLSTSVYAFAPTPRPWSPTPERFLRTVPDHELARVSPIVHRLGLEVYSFRSDGSVAIVWGAPATAPSNMSPDGASEVALGLATAMAPELGVSANDLYVRHVSILEGWGNVSIGQTIAGIDAPAGFIQFTFREGQIASIRNELVAHRIADFVPAIALEAATEKAIREAKTFANSSELVVGAQLEIWTASDHAEDARLAFAVRTRSESPPSEFTFHIDAGTGSILAVDDDIRFADGEGRVRIVVDTVSPDDGQEAYTATFLELDGVDTDSDGEAQRQSSATASYRGPLVRIRDSSGTPVEQFDVDLSGPYGPVDHQPQFFSQADPFVHLNIVKLFAAQYTPNLGWIGRQLTSNVNINDNCNAFWNGQSVNFFRSGGGCNNTGRIASIIYHEFGHGYHGNLTNNTVGSIGEGTGDFLAGTILNDPIVGRGFSTNGNGIRRMDRNKAFPGDYVGEVHADGLIWATALWELRAAMIEKHGEWAGRIAVERAFILALTEGPGLSTSYPSVLTADDDDNNPNNGTPNSCEINAIFDAHGLVDGGQINHDFVPTRSFVRIDHAGPGRIAKGTEGITLDVSTENRSTCGSYDPNALQLHYAINDGTTQTMSPAMQGAAGSAVVPGVEPGDVVRYWFDIDADGSTFTSGSEGSPHVVLVDPEDVTLFSEDFESGFGEWTHGTVGSDLHDDWDVDAPHGLRYDPDEAHSGTNVAGTDLGLGGGPAGTNGAAKPGRSTFLESPLITTEGMENIRVGVWHHFIVDGELRLMIDGETVFTHTDDGSAWSGGWRYLTFELPDAANDRADGFTLRFEVDTNANNNRGGWTIDDVLVSGAMIPPPPPPPPPPPQMPPPKNPGDPTNPMTPGVPNPADPTTPNPQDPAPQAPGDDARGLTRGSLSGSCTCVAPRTATPLYGLLGLGFLVILGIRRRP